MKPQFSVAVFLLFLFSFSKSYGQLSGTYTIGGMNPDYPDVIQALQGLTSQGISGPVVFNVRNGTYEGHHLGTIYFTGSSNINTVTFQSESGDSSSVIISDTTGFTFDISNEYFIFKNITIQSHTETINGYAFTVIENSVLQSTGTCLQIRDCIINNSRIDGYFGIGLNGTTQVSNSIFQTGNSGTNGIGGVNVNVSHCIFHCGLGFGGTNNVVFDSNSVDGYFSVSGSPTAIIKNNILSIYGQYSGGTDCAFSNGIQFYNNIVYASCGFSYSPHSKIIGNKFHCQVGIGFSEYSLIENNFIDSTFNLTSGYCKVYNNNFNPDIYWDFSWGGDFRNNILPAHCEGYPSGMYNNNVYPGSWGQYDATPINVDPQYVSTSDLHTKNPLLIGHGVPITGLVYDIDSVLRPSRISIGANEICISSDTIKTICGDSVMLRLCNMPTSGNLIWTPALGLNNASTEYPFASPTATTTYIVRDSITNYADTITLEILPFNVFAGNDTMIHCGDSIRLDASLNFGATYSWSPANGLDSSNVRRPWAKPSQTTTYILSSTTSCGISFDTIKIIVDSLPQANYYLGSLTGLTVSLINASTCADTYYWNFGNGDTSTVVNPTEVYGAAGTYTITLIACNTYGCDTIQYTVTVVDTYVAPILSENDINVYPNPSADKFVLELNKNLGRETEILVYDLLGNVIYDSELLSNNAELDLSGQNSGFYFLKVKASDGSFVTRKLLLQR
ncbi:MAG TPA: T9SS type A sorting domain-containing protein [Bacteroidia bacterium]|jgi:PKD repeat protein|nr:T9SS type A sorting domain-containing protein [Bacteroidia bacterium]